MEQNRVWPRIGKATLALVLTFNFAAAPVLFAAPTAVGSYGSAGSTQSLNNLIGGGLFGGATQFPNQLFGQVSTVFQGCGTSLNATCNDSIPDTFSAETSCDNASLSSINQQRSDAQRVISNIQCKIGQLGNLRKEVQCLSTSAQGLANTLGQLQQFFTDTIQSIQKNVVEAKGVIEDMEKQRADALTKLNGSEQGNKGLRKVKEQVAATVLRMPDSITQIKQGHLRIASLKKTLEESVATRRMALTTQCFTTDTKPDYQCGSDPKALSASDYAKCKFEVNSMGNEVNAVLKQQAQAKSAELKALLDEIFANAPKNPNIPDPTNANPQDGSKQAEAFENQAFAILSPDQIAAKYGKRLQAFDINAQGRAVGVNISSFVLGTIRTCYDQKAAQVEQERKMSSSAIGKRQFAIQAEEKGVRTEINKFVDGFATNYNEATGVLSGINNPLNTGGCIATNQTPDGQEKCLDDAYVNLKGMLEGSTKNSTVNMVVKGTRPQNFFTFQCQGLNGCIQKMENFVTNAENGITRAKTTLRAEVTSRNQALTSYRQQFANTLSPQSRALDERLQAINSALASFGVEGLIERKNVKGEEFEEDDKEKFDGLYKIPKSSYELVGGAMVPPMLDVRENIFQAAMTSMAKRIADLGKNQADINKDVATLSGLHSKCEKERKKEELAERRAQAAENADRRDAGQSPIASGGSGSDSGSGGSTSGGLESGQLLGGLRDALGIISGGGATGSFSTGGSNGGLAKPSNVGGQKATYPGLRAVGQKAVATSNVCQGSLVGGSIVSNPVDLNVAINQGTRLDGAVCSRVTGAVLPELGTPKGGEFIRDSAGRPKTGGGAQGSGAGSSAHVPSVGNH